MKLRKVWLSLLLAVTMVVTVLPAAALAEKDEGSQSQYALSFNCEGMVNLNLMGSYKEVTASLWNSALNEGNGDSVADKDWDIVWTSSNENIVSFFTYYEKIAIRSIDDNLTPVSNSSKTVGLHAKSPGQATVTATASIGGTEVARNSLTVNVPEPEGISVGQTKTVNSKKGAVFAFKPTKTAQYIFYSQGSGGANYDPDMDIRAQDYEENPDEYIIYSKLDIDDKAGNMNFECCFSAIAGHTYYLNAYAYAYGYTGERSEGSGEYSFTVGLKYGPKDQAEEVIASANALPVANYKPASFSKMVSAKQYLENLMKDPKATDEQIYAAADALKAAISNLQRKAANTLAVKSVNKSYKARKMNKKKIFKAVTIKNRGQGALTYAVKPANKKSKKALSFNKKNGKITVKKRTKKGVYKMIITIKTAGNNDHLPGTVTKTITVKVKK